MNLTTTAIMINAMFNIGAVLVGGIITWFVAWRYYVRASRELEAESKELRKLLEITLQSLSDAGMVTLVRDASGKIIGMNYKLIVDSITHRHSIESPLLNGTKKEENAK